MKKIELECGSYTNGDCTENPVNCVFENYELAKEKVNCSGDNIFIQIDSSSRCKNLNCMSKCIRKLFENESDCNIVCP